MKNKIKELKIYQILSFSSGFAEKENYEINRNMEFKKLSLNILYYEYNL